jgi:hypothetical protein
VDSFSLINSLMQIKLAKVSDFDLDADFESWYSGLGLSCGFPQLLQENINAVHQITPWLFSSERFIVYRHPIM